MNTRPSASPISVDLADEGVIERSSREGFAALEPRVFRKKHLANAAGAEG